MLTISKNNDNHLACIKEKRNFAMFKNVLSKK